MKDTNKVTLTVSQLKKLIQESRIGWMQGGADIRWCRKFLKSLDEYDLDEFVRRIFTKLDVTYEQDYHKWKTITHCYEEWASGSRSGVSVLEDLGNEFIDLVKEIEDYFNVKWDGTESLTEDVEDFTPDYVKVPFNKSKLMKLGFRKIMYHAEDHFWSDAMDEALILCTPCILMICGNDNGNRYLEVSPASDKSASYLMYEPTDENIKNLADTLYPEADIHEGINADYIPL